MNTETLPFAQSGVFSFVWPLILMAIIAVALFAWFRHKRWL
jgi:Mg2+ and Co2+ transporter CorA